MRLAAGADSPGCGCGCGCGWPPVQCVCVCVSTSYWTHIPANVVLLTPRQSNKRDREMLIREPGKNKSGLEKYCTIMMAIDVYWILCSLARSYWAAMVARVGRRL